MRIKLYIENDSRPRGSYENVIHAEVAEDLIIFKSSSGKEFVTNLRFCLEVESGDRYVPRAKGTYRDNVLEIIGAPRPIKEPKAHKASDSVPQASMFDDNKVFGRIPKGAHFSKRDVQAEEDKF